MYHGERFNAITHLVGTVLALVGLPVLVVTAWKTGGTLPVVTFSVYGSTLVLLYLLSTLYHSVKGRPKEVFQKLDHAAIFLLIAGTYTPVALCTVEGTMGWTIFGTNWGLAVVGVILSFAPWRHSRVVSHVLYVVMGWLAVVAIEALLHEMTAAGNVLIFAGRLLYTVGIGA